MPVHNQFIHDGNKDPNPTGLVVIGAVFPIEVHVPPALATVLAAQGQPIPTPAVGMAIIDTGATMTCVHEPMLQGLGLNPVAVVNTGTANGPVQQSVYPARLVFPTKGWVIDLAEVAGVNLAGQGIPLDPPQPAIALIGRNVLGGWVFTYNGPGGFWTVAH